MSCKTRFVAGSSLSLSLSLRRRVARHATTLCVSIMMALSPEFNWLDNFDKISPWARAHAEGLVVDVVDGRLALRSEDSYAINEVVGN